MDMSMEIRCSMYILPQAGILVNLQIQNFLVPHAD